MNSLHANECIKTCIKTEQRTAFRAIIKHHARLSGEQARIGYLLAALYAVCCVLTYSLHAECLFNYIFTLQYVDLKKKKIL